jgi:hypothetical protein
MEITRKKWEERGGANLPIPQLFQSESEVIGKLNEKRDCDIKLETFSPI